MNQKLLFNKKKQSKKQGSNIERTNNKQRRKEIKTNSVIEYGYYRRYKNRRESLKR